MAAVAGAVSSDAVDPVERQSIRRVIAASSVGTLIEWYDFYIFGTLATIIAARFYPAGNDTANFLKTLATFGAGFAVRPLGALVFGRMGDLVGRKVTFVTTLLIMGGSTAAIGMLPTYATAGIFAPIMLVVLRLAQGLALGGEYGGAAVYVAEHAPDNQRGYYTAFIQTTATLGLFASLLVILGVRHGLGDAAFNEWGWRVPFLLSALLVAFSYYIRMKLGESPVYAAMKSAGKTSSAPVRESFGSAERWKVFFMVLFGVSAGQAVVWYTGQFYSLYFLQTVLKVPQDTAFTVVAVGLLLGTPLFLVFGSLSDKVGRKPLILAGNLLGALCFYPVYKAMAAAANPVQPVVLTALVFVQMIFVALAYAPVAAYLVELFPARIRYTSLSVPYHFGNGWFGGFLPLIATWAVAKTGNIYAGLAWPIGVALLSFTVGLLFLKETKQAHLYHEGRVV
jgi:MFS family permease